MLTGGDRGVLQYGEHGHDTLVQETARSGDLLLVRRSGGWRMHLPCHREESPPSCWVRNPRPLKFALRLLRRLQLPVDNAYIGLRDS